MLKFKDTEGNTIHVRPDAIAVVLTKSPLTATAKDENLIFINGGIKSHVTHAVAMDVLAELEKPAAEMREYVNAIMAKH